MLLQNPNNDLINAIGKKSMVEFRAKYRNADILQ